jgi:hypothetical protein
MIGAIAPHGASLSAPWLRAPPFTGRGAIPTLSVKTPLRLLPVEQKPSGTTARTGTTAPSTTAPKPAGTTRDQGHLHGVVEPGW